MWSFGKPLLPRALSVGASCVDPIRSAGPHGTRHAHARDAVSARGRAHSEEHELELRLEARADVDRAELADEAITVLKTQMMEEVF